MGHPSTCRLGLHVRGGGADRRLGEAKPAGETGAASGQVVAILMRRRAPSGVTARRYGALVHAHADRRPARRDPRLGEPARRGGVEPAARGSTSHRGRKRTGRGGESVWEGAWSMALALPARRALLLSPLHRDERRPSTTSYPQCPSRPGAWRDLRRCPGRRLRRPLRGRVRRHPGALGLDTSRQDQPVVVHGRWRDEHRRRRVDRRRGHGGSRAPLAPARRALRAGTWVRARDEARARSVCFRHAVEPLRVRSLAGGLPGERGRRARHARRLRRVELPRPRSPERSN